MRGWFAGELFNAMQTDSGIYLMAIDLTYKMWDKHFESYPDRAFNTFATETATIGMAAGLAQDGKKPFTYTISSFYMRAAEPIALYVAREQLPVVMIGSGRDDDYKHDGPSHNATLTQDFMKLIGIKSYYPEDKEEMPDLMQELLTLNEPAFVSLKR
jgi:transketolase